MAPYPIHGLPTEARGPESSPPSLKLRRTTFTRYRERRLVGLGRFELPTSRLSSARSNQLSYRPEACDAATSAGTRTLLTSCVPSLRKGYEDGAPLESA